MVAFGKRLDDLRAERGREVGAQRRRREGVKELVVFGLLMPLSFSFGLFVFGFLALDLLFTCLALYYSVLRF